MFQFALILHDLTEEQIAYAFQRVNTVGGCFLSSEYEFFCFDGNLYGFSFALVGYGNESFCIIEETIEFAQFLIYTFFEGFSYGSIASRNGNIHRSNPFALNSLFLGKFTIFRTSIIVQIRNFVNRLGIFYHMISFHYKKPPFQAAFA